MNPTPIQKLQNDRERLLEQLGALKCSPIFTDLEKEALKYYYLETIKVYDKAIDNYIKSIDTEVNIY